MAEASPALTWDDVSIGAPADAPIPTDAAEAPAEDPAAAWDAVSQATDPVEEGGGVGLEAAAGQVAGSATRGAIETGGFMAGAVPGAKIGLAATAAIPIPGARVLGTGAGFLIGGIAGHEAGEYIANTLERFGFASKKAEEVAPKLRPFAYGGEIFGGSVAGGASVVNMAQQGMRLPASFVGNFINRALDSAARSPLTAMGIEAATGSTAAVAGGMSEKILPGQTGARVTAEIAGGLINPVTHVTNIAKGTLKLTAGAFKSFSTAAQKSIAGDTLTKIIQEGGGDVELVMKLLREADDIGILRTAAQRTGDPGLAALEAHFRQTNAKFAGESKDLAEGSLEMMERMTVALREVGDPNALALAAKFEQNRFKALIASRVAAAEQEAAEAAAKVTKDTPEARAALSMKANEALTTAMQQTRTVERELWDKVDGAVEVTGENTLAVIRQLKDELSPGMKLPDVLEAFLKKYGAADEAVLSGETGLAADAAEFMARKAGKDAEAPPALTAKDLIKLRSNLLQLVRGAHKSTAETAVGNARMYGMAAEHILDDLDMISDPAYDTARAFSRDLNETFTRSFAGHAMAKGTRGDRLPPEIMLERALATGATRRAGQLAELENATRFLTEQGRFDPETMIDTSGAMMDAQERMLRLAAFDTSTKNADGTRTINPGKLLDFIEQNKTLIGRFEGMEATLREAATSENARKSLEGTMKNASKIIQKQAAFSKLADVENPSLAVKHAIEGSSPIKDIRRLAKLAKRGGEEAMAGLQASVLDSAFMRASGGTGKMDFAAYRNIFSEPIAPGQPTLAQVLKKEGIFDDGMLKHIDDIMGEAEKIQKAREATGAGMQEKLETGGSVFENLVIRILGSRAATGIAANVNAGVPQNSLIVAKEGSSFTQKILSRMPQKKIQQFMMDALLDPALMKELLTTPKSAQEAFRLNMKLHGYAVQSLGQFVDRQLPELEFDSSVEETQ